MKQRGLVIVVALLMLSLTLGAWAARRGQESAPAPPTQQPTASARFAFRGDAAEIPARFIGDLVLVPAHVNRSQPCLFELDSTAAISTIDPERAGELAIPNLRTPALNFSGVDILLGGLPEAAKKDFGAHVGRPYEGTVGNDVFGVSVIEVDYARQTVRFYDPATYKYSGRGTSLHLTFVGGMPVVRAKFVAIGGKSVEGHFVVNTALDASLVISGKSAQTHHLLSSHAKVNPAADLELGGAADAVFERAKAFDMGPFHIEEPLAVFSRGSSPLYGNAALAGEIGGGILRRFTVVFDYPHQRIILDSNSEFRTDDREDMSGISLSAGGPGFKTLEVTQVQPGTPGADGGVLKGDIIAGINDEASADLTLEEVREMFRQVGHKYKLLVERNGKTINLAIQMRRLY